jgi:hypothetical protein
MGEADGSESRYDRRIEWMLLDEVVLASKILI